MIWRLIVGLLIVSHFCYGQNELVVEGKVRDAASDRGVVASIRYSTLPTGSMSGSFRDSVFTFTIFGTARYKVSAEAPGYHPRSVIVDPELKRDTQGLTADILLIPKAETVVLEHLIFEQGNAVIQKNSYEELDALVNLMEENKTMVIQLEGHTDNLGTPRANMDLSEQRVLAVKNYLISEGISKNRIKTKAYGGTQPLKTNASSEARAANRRVEMRILKN
jgi:OmpA-OmpF porin, OOP family